MMRRASILTLGLLLAGGAIFSSVDRAPALGAEREPVAALWDNAIPFPTRQQLSYPAGAADVVVHRAGTDGFSFLHDSAIEHEGKLSVVYTSEKHHCMMTSFPVKSLAVECRKASHQSGGELLYNGIRLPHEWPPRDVDLRIAISTRKQPQRPSLLCPLEKGTLHAPQRDASRVPASGRLAVDCFGRPAG